MPGIRKLPKGPVFFTRDASTPYRRTRIIFVLIIGLAILMTGWPLYPYFSSIYPLVLGLPFSLAWIILWLAVSLVALIILFITEPQ